MAARTSIRDFQFIVFNGPQMPNDPKTRAVIRKQAMEDVGAARKGRGNHRRVNCLQYPAFDRRTDGPKEIVGYGGNDVRESVSMASRAGAEPTSTFTAGPATKVTASRELIPFDHVTASLGQYWTLLPSLVVNPSNDYEALRAEHHFDVMDLCSLTTFHVGRSTMLAMAQNSNLLGTLLGKQLSSYLSFVPSRYGHKPYLTAVVDCVTAKARSTLYPSDACFSATVLKLYAKALRAIQNAVNDEKASRDADLLCAVQMLCFYEILEPERTSAFVHHVSGAANLIKHRSPSSFTTPYEQMLFLAHIGPAFSEAFYKSEPCYITQPEWMGLYESLAEETPHITERSPLVIRIRKALLRTSGMLLETSRALTAEGQNDPGLLLTLELRIREVHHDVINCVEEYKGYVGWTSLTGPPESTFDVGREAFGSALECLCVYKRMLAALCETDRRRLEAECQLLAVFILQAHDRPSARQSWVYTGLEHGVALVIQTTRSSWEEDVTGQSALEQRLASRKRWHTFRGHIMGSGH